MAESKIIRSRIGKTILITVGGTYILTLLIVGLLMSVTTVNMQTAQIIRFSIAGIIGFATWNILKKNEPTSGNEK